MLDTSEPNENSNEGSSRRSGGGSSIFGDVMTIAMGMLGNPVTIGVIGFVVGLALGLIMGWWIWPVQWENATPSHLRADLQEEWVRMTVDSYIIRSDPVTAIERLEELGAAAVPAMNRVAANPGEEIGMDLILEEVRILYEASTGSGGDGGGGAAEPAEEGSEEQSPAASSNGFGGLLMACSFTLLLGVALAVVFYLRRGRRGGNKASTPAQQAQQISQQVQMTDYAAMGQEPPIAQWMTTYLKGDDLFDDSFSIDSPSGEFMGECGVGIADTIGVGEPKRVSAFEVWLFDKDDIQTITKVVMSSHLFRDEASMGRLAAKGEPMEARPGGEVTLETESLQMVVRVVDMAYGDGAAPDNSFFERITLELSIWKK